MLLSRIAAILGAASILASCVAPYRRVDGATGAPNRGAVMHADSILAPVMGSRELRHLDRGSAPGQLRRAHVLTETGAARRAVTELNRLLFGTRTPNASTKAWALYLRSRAYSKQGDAERATYDREGAHALAVEAGLRDLLERTDDRPAEPAAPAVLVEQLVVMPRVRWQAAPPVAGRMRRMGRVTRLTIHHSGVLARPGARRAAAAIRGIQRTHVGQRGWGDIGYHFLIDRDGGVWTGRPVEWQGAHAGDAARNAGNIGICLLGSFVAGNAGQAVPPAQFTALERLVRALARQHGIAPSRIYTHRELRSTECPGDRLHARVSALRQSL